MPVDDKVRERVDWLRSCGVSKCKISKARLDQPMSDHAFQLLATMMFAQRARYTNKKGQHLTHEVTNATT